MCLRSKLVTTQNETLKNSSICKGRHLSRATPRAMAAFSMILANTASLSGVTPLRIRYLLNAKSKTGNNNCNVSKISQRNLKMSTKLTSAIERRISRVRTLSYYSTCSTETKILITNPPESDWLNQKGQSF